MSAPSVKTLLNLQEKVHEIAFSLISSIEAWVPQAPSAEYVVEYLGLDPNDYDLDSPNDLIELQRLWLAEHVYEQAMAITRKVYDQHTILLMDNEER